MRVKRLQYAILREIAQDCAYSVSAIADEDGYREFSSLSGAFRYLGMLETALEKNALQHTSERAEFADECEDEDGDDD